MTVNSKYTTQHPEYIESHPNWEFMTDSLDATKFKGKGTRYLPATQSMVNAGMTVGEDGYKMYSAYKLRAVYHELVPVALEAMVGLVNKRQIKIEVPKALEPMLNNFSKSGESIFDFHKRVNESQLLQGRVGLLTDVKTGTEVTDTPHVVLYNANSIVNWATRSDDCAGSALDFILLNESRRVLNRATYLWEFRKYFKCLELINGIYTVTDYDQDNDSVTEVIAPQMAGNTLDELPFVICGASDLNPCVDRIPLLPLANVARHIYLGEADYRHTLFMQTQDTLVTIGGNGKIIKDDFLNKTGHTTPEEIARQQSYSDVIQTGAGAHIGLPMGGDAKYIGVSSKGIEHQRQALEDLKQSAASMGAQLISNSGGSKEAAEALRIRLLAKTSSLTQIVTASAEAIKHSLRYAAMFKGLDPDDVKVTPQTDFGDLEKSAKEINDLIDAKLKGFPLSSESLHAVAVASGLTNKSYEEEKESIDVEPPLDFGTGVEDDNNTNDDNE